MKKIIAMLLTVIFGFSFSPVYVKATKINSIAYGEKYSELKFNSEYYSKEPDFNLWDKFIKYDLCITDYDSLTDEEKELCEFIFETERSANGTIICERARRILSGDNNIGERITLEQLNDCYGIWDNYSPFKYGYQNYIDCVPDIKCLDKWNDYNEYWLDDEGTMRVQFTGENSGSLSDKIHIYKENGSYEIETKKFLNIDAEGKKFYVPENYIENNGDYYYIKDDNTAVLVKSKYSETSFASSEKIIVPDEINGYPVTAIERWAFLNSCATEIILPDTIEFINAGAFQNNIYLEKINIPSNLKYIGEEAFAYCDSLKEINIDSPKLNISPYAFYGDRQLVNVNLNVKSIDNNVFQNCTSLKNLILSNNIEKIGVETFYNCSSLENISLPDSLKIIGCGAFSKYSEEENSIKSITIPSNVKVIGALPRAKGEAPTSGLYIPSTDPLTEEQPCVFSSDCMIYGYQNTEAELYANENNLKFIPLDLKYDANQDGNIDIADVVTVASYVVNPEKNSISEQAVINADVQNSGNGLDANDCLMIQKYICNEN